MNDAGEFYIGMISGTSVDGIDTAMVRFNNNVPEMVAARIHAWPDPLRRHILALSQNQAQPDLATYGYLDASIGICFAKAAQGLLEYTGIQAARVRAIGSHGQTLCHRPYDQPAFTLQIGDPNVIAERCGIDVVADFRRADVAAGGHGAPLLPALHAMLFNVPSRPRVVLNLGGIANLTVLNGAGRVSGFDTGPGNGLLDAWCLRHRGEAFDRDGRFAASGQVDLALLKSLLDDPYFASPPPKSSGRDYFQLAWLEAQPRITTLSASDIQATLLELTVHSVSHAILTHASDSIDVLVCGGGAQNPLLMRRLSEELTPRKVASTATVGIDPDSLEAIAFAWLARQRVLGRPGNLPAVTGACGLRVLGAIYAAPGGFFSTERL